MNNNLIKLPKGSTISVLKIEECWSNFGKSKFLVIWNKCCIPLLNSDGALWISFQTINWFCRIWSFGCVIIFSQSIGWCSPPGRLPKHVVLPVVNKQVPPTPDQPSETDDIFLETSQIAAREKRLFFSFALYNIRSCIIVRLQLYMKTYLCFRSDQNFFVPNHYASVEEILNPWDDFH